MGTICRLVADYAIDARREELQFSALRNDEIVGGRYGGYWGIRPLEETLTDEVGWYRHEVKMVRALARG